MDSGVVTAGGRGAEWEKGSWTRGGTGFVGHPQRRARGGPGSRTTRRHGGGGGERGRHHTTLLFKLAILDFVHVTAMTEETHQRILIKTLTL